MNHFLEGVIVGFFVGGIVAYFAYDRVTIRMAKAILYEDETCHR